MPDLSLMGVQPLWTAAGLLALLLIIFCRAEPFRLTRIDCRAVRRSRAAGDRLVGMEFFRAFNPAAVGDGARGAGRARIAAHRRGDRAGVADSPASITVRVTRGKPPVKPPIFLKPETVAAATAYVEAKLRLLADSSNTDATSIPLITVR